MTTPILKVVKLNPDDPINHSHPLTGYNFNELFVVVGEFPGTYQPGNGHYLLHRWMANGSNKPGLMPGMIGLDRFIDADPDNDF